MVFFQDEIIKMRDREIAILRETMAHETESEDEEAENKDGKGASSKASWIKIYKASSFKNGFKIMCAITYKREAEGGVWFSLLKKEGLVNFYAPTK